MFASLGRGLAALIRFGGPAWAVRRTIARDRASIVLFHDPDPEMFERQLRWMLRRYSVIGLGRLVGAVRSGDWSALPWRSLVITFDDGRPGNERLVEVLRRHRVEPTMYLCSALLGGRGGSGFEVVDAAGAERLANAFDLQSHGGSHPVLPDCDEAEAWRQISGSREEVEALSGARCEHFAYPAGAYGEREVEMVERAGYASARTIDNGWVHRGSDPYRLRILSQDSPSVTVLAAELAGLRWLARLANRRGRLGGRALRRPGL